MQLAQTKAQMADVETECSALRDRLGELDRVQNELNEHKGRANAAEAVYARYRREEREQASVACPHGVWTAHLLLGGPVGEVALDGKSTGDCCACVGLRPSYYGV